MKTLYPLVTSFVLVLIYFTNNCYPFYHNAYKIKSSGHNDIDNFDLENYDEDNGNIFVNITSEVFEDGQRESRRTCNSHRDCMHYQHCSCSNYCHHTCKRRRRRKGEFLSGQMMDPDEVEEFNRKKRSCRSVMENSGGMCRNHDDCGCNRGCSCSGYCMHICVGRR